MLHSFKKIAQLSAALCLAASVGFAAPVLTNGGFEDNPPAGFGNNIGHSIAPWVLGTGDSSNVVKVDDGARNYGNQGPKFDATNPGVGIDQHYLDIANGSNDFYQEFTPLCEGRVEYGAYISRRPSGAQGAAGITLLNASDDSVAEARQSISLPLGSPVTDPWTRVAYQTTLVAGTAYKFYVDMDNDMNIDNAFVVFLDQCDAHDAPDFTTGVPDAETPNEVIATSTVKTCVAPEETPTGLSASCTISVTHGTEPFDSLQLEEAFSGANGSQITLISSLSSAEAWVCSAVPPASDLDAVTCDIAGADIVAGSITTIDVVLDLSSADAGDYENCAKLTGITIGETPLAGTDQVDNTEYLALEPSCTPITVVKSDVVDPPKPKPAQCTPFEAEVKCDSQNGGYVVTLANSLSGTFDPILVEVDVLTAGVSAVSHANNPLRMQLLGANPGDTVLMSIAATDEGGGSQKGLDLCCMGEVSVSVPKGLVCDPPKDPTNEQVLSISKTCEATAPGFGAGNTVCHMDVTYSGPPPSPSNPIVVTDAIASGSGVTSINAQDPTGATKDVWACNGFGAGPVTCQMHSGIDGTQTAGYWDNYTTTLDLYLDAMDTYKNCTAASVTLKDGTVVKAEDCHSEGDAELEIVKTAKFEVCTPGTICQFEYTVHNNGSGDYNGAITLNDAITPIGGTFTAITPALCDPAALTGAGCTGTANIAAGGATTYTVDYMAPSNAGPVLGEGVQAGENCVMLTDETMGEFDDPNEIDGHKSCIEFMIGEPNLSMTKVLKGSCLPGEVCNFEIQISSQGVAYEGNIALGESMGGVGGSITNVTPALPAACTLPTGEFGCVVPVSVPANGSYTLSVEATYDAVMEGEDHNRNCAIAMTVPSSVPTGPFDLNVAPEWAPAAGEIGEACVEFEELTDTECGEGEMMNAAGVCVPTEDDAAELPGYTLAKTCVPNEAGTVCAITVVSNGTPFSGNLTISDVLNVADTAGMTITGPAGTVCDNASLSCTITHSVISGYTPANTAVFTVEMPASDTEGLMNCASGTHPDMEPQSDCVLLDGEFDTPSSPPEVIGSCETDFIFVVDKSGSLNEDATGNYSPARASRVSMAVRKMASIAVGNGSQASLIEFDSDATTPTAMSVTSLSNLASSYWITASGGTNWEAALVAANGILPNSGRDTIMYFITDGRPTAYVDMTGNINLPNTPASWLRATNEAIPAVNSIYANGVKIVGVGVSDGNGMFVSTYLDALLGTNTVGASFNSLESDLAQIAGDMCPNILLDKFMDGTTHRTVQFASAGPDSQTINVLLRVQNPTSNTLTSVTVEDAIPIDLTNPGTAVLSTGVSSLTGQTFSWNIPTLAPGATETATFTVDISKHERTICTSADYGTNFAQVTAIGGGAQLQSTPNSMNPTAGPVVESDEASAQYCAFTRDSIPSSCTNVLKVDKYPDFAETCVAGTECAFKVKVRPSCSGEGWDGPVFFGDKTSIDGGAAIAPTITSITNDKSPTLCAYPSEWTTTPNGRICSDNLVLSANETVTFDVTMTAPPAGHTYQNCFHADGQTPTPTDFTSVSGLYNTSRNQTQSWGDCTTFEVSENKSLKAPVTPAEPEVEQDFPPTEPDLPVLTPAKVLVHACDVSESAQTYTCEFELSVTNTGSAPFKGPIALDDSFGEPKPSSLTANGEGWECMRTDGTGSSCLNGTAALEPGQSTSMVMTTVIPSSPTGAKFENCLAVGISESDFLRASVIQTVMQRLGIDGGPVDGAPGRKTREGIRQLQERLGQTPTGEIDDALFAAVGLPSAANAEKVCITADLPPVKRPVRCEAPQVKNSKGVCYTPKVECRSGQVKNSQGRCYTPKVDCPSGQVKNSKGQCYTPSKPQTAASCDARSTVQRGEACACRYSGMRQANARSCVCSNTGLAPIGGLGCPSVTIGGTSDEHEGDAKCRLKINGICIK